MTRSTLSLRQIQILQCAAQGMLRWEAAEALGISENTVRVHLGLIHRKLNARNTTHAVVLALSRGLISFEEA